MHHIDLRHHLQVFEGQVPGTAITCRPVVDAPRFTLGSRDEFPQIAGRKRGVDCVERSDLAQETDRCKVGDRIIGKLAEHPRVHRQRSHMPEDEGVPVGLCACHILHRDIARAARSVLDHELLAEAARHLHHECPRNDFRTAAGRKGHDHSYRSSRVALRPRNRRNQGREHDSEHRSAMLEHGGLLARAAGNSTGCLAQNLHGWIIPIPSPSPAHGKARALGSQCGLR